MKNKNHIAFGLTGALLTVVLFFGQYFMNISSQNQVLRWVPILLLIGVVIAGCINYSKINEGDVTFGEVFGNGFKITAIITLICIVVYAAFAALVPEFKERIIEEGVTNAPPGQATEEQMQQGVEWMRKNFMLMLVAGTLFMNLLAGVVAALIGAAVAKKK